MKPLRHFNANGVRVLLTDIDGTLTEHGRLPDHSYRAISELSRAGLHVVPVTGRPAGWCEMIARLWPVHGVIGENGALYFRHDGRTMTRYFARAKAARKADRENLRAIRREVLASIPGTAVASDQFCRLFDLAIDFAEDVPPLPKHAIEDIVAIFTRAGATAKVSNIHVNGWFGQHDKLSTAKVYLQKEFGWSETEMLTAAAYVGDSPNDEPMFAHFPNSIAVANIKDYLTELKHLPAFITEAPEGHGFVELASRLLALKV